jgi:hypothetical protein
VYCEPARSTETQVRWRSIAQPEITNNNIKRNGIAEMITTTSIHAVVAALLLPWFANPLSVSSSYVFWSTQSWDRMGDGRFQGRWMCRNLQCVNPVRGSQHWSVTAHTQQWQDEPPLHPPFGHQVPDMTLYGYDSDNWTAPRKTGLTPQKFALLPSNSRKCVFKTTCIWGP